MLVHGGEERGHVPVFDCDSLGSARGARRVHHVREVLGPTSRLERCVVLPEGASVGIEVHDTRTVFRQVGQPRPGRQQDLDARVLDHERETVLREGGIEGHIGPARLQDGDHADDGLHRPLRNQPDNRSRLYTQPDQMTSEAVRPPIELLIGHAEGAVSERGIFHRFGGAVPKLAVDRALGRQRVFRGVPVMQNLVAPGLRKEGDLADRDIRVLGHLTQHGLEGAEHRLDPLPTELPFVGHRHHLQRILAVHVDRQVRAETLTQVCLAVRPSSAEGTHP